MLRAVKLLLGLLVVTGGLLCVPSVRDAVLPPVAAWLDIDQSPECVPYVLILPGDESRRSLTAAGLIRIGLAQDVLIPENPESADVKDGITLPTAQISRLILLHTGITDDHILLLPTQSRTTFDDARALAEFLRDQEPLAEFLRDQEPAVTVVTSAFHTRRTSFVFRKVFGTDAHRIRVVSAPNPGFGTSDWWFRREGLRLILTEYLKLAFYYVRYSDPLTHLTWALPLAALGVWRVRSSRQSSGNRKTDSRHDSN
jgi:uncharacterized SAM-binding protein YcdF (DUF218 family)